MRHGAKVNHLSRTASHRRSLLSNLACELIRHKRISTTLAKAKSLRVYVEPLLTKSKSNTTHQRRIVFGYLQDKEAVTELFTTVSGKIASRPGGYTRIIKLGKRMGDAAEIALIELVDFNETYTKSAGAAKEGAAKRTRRGGKKKAEETGGTPPAPAVETAAAETVTAGATTPETPATVEPDAKEKTGE